jgi:hypothetical protein
MHIRGGGEESLCSREVSLVAFSYVAVTNCWDSYLRALERRQDGLPSPGSLGDGIRPRPRHSSVSDYGISGVVTRDASMVADGGE